MQLLKYGHLLLTALFFIACNKNVTIEIPGEENKPVINVLMNKDSILYVRITLSGMVDYSRDFTEPKDAVVQLYENGQFKETLSQKRIGYYNYNRNYYYSATKMKPGATYRVTAAIPGYEIAEGSDVIPDSVKTGEKRYLSIPIGNGQSDTKVVLELHDKGGEKNYYRIRIFNYYTMWVPDGTMQLRKETWPLWFKSDQPELGIFDKTDKQEFFTDDGLFDGRSPRFVFSLEGSYKSDTLLVEVSALTVHSYRYLQSASLAAGKNEDGLSEKVLVYNNIKNGLGIAGGVAIKEYLVFKK